MSINTGALKWANHGQKNQRYADGYRSHTSYVLTREEGVHGALWKAWFHDALALVPNKLLGQGNYIQARAYAISHHHVQKGIML